MRQLIKNSFTYVCFSAAIVISDGLLEPEHLGVSSLVHLGWLKLGSKMPAIEGRPTFLGGLGAGGSVSPSPHPAEFPRPFTRI